MNKVMSLLSKKVNDIQDKYELTKSVKLADVKGYLQKEYDRASEREDMIRTLENKVEELEKISMKYDAMLVIQENTQKRIEKQDSLIKELREKLKIKNEEIRLKDSKIIDIKTNAETRLKEKDEEIKLLNRELKSKTKTSKTKKKVSDV